MALLSTTLPACGGDDDGDDGADSAADDSGDDGDADDGGADDATPADDGGAIDNVAACEDFVDAWDCGDIDVAQFVMCSAYENVTCDVADYFQCLADETTCDISSLMSAVNSCASLASCG
jgi:hypothetical protein